MQLIRTIPCYIVAASLLRVMDRMLQSRAGALMLGLAVILLINAVIVPMQLPASSRAPEWKEVADHLLRYSPPGAAATLLAGTGLSTSPYITLCGCCSKGGLYVLRRA
jgi:hypothetical protein